MIADQVMGAFKGDKEGEMTQQFSQNPFEGPCGTQMQSFFSKYSNQPLHLTSAKNVLIATTLTLALANGFMTCLSNANKKRICR
jgi:hypothetical protein